VPVRAELAHRLAQLDHRMFHGMQREHAQLQHRLSGLARGLPDPRALLDHAAQRADDLAERLPHALQRRLDRAQHALTGLGARLGTPAQRLNQGAAQLHGPSQKLDYLLRGCLRDHARHLDRTSARLGLGEITGRLSRHGQVLAGLSERKRYAMGRRVGDAGEALRNLASLLIGLSYEGVLARGFALVRDERGQLVPSAARALAEIALEIQFRDGRVPTLVARAGAPKQIRPGARPPGEQRRLL
jgi:exodeoxyribonuclease VII large subunit